MNNKIISGYQPLQVV